ncbi:MAG TPA: ferrous iron transport protein B [Chloroflexi bacterium]|nr:ferrous iron transport protein B [Chloroflexota bacterium]
MRRGMAETRKLTLALAGNPNAGKSTLFNALTGSHQHVGNWPGKTVESKRGHFRLDSWEMEVVDLPGTYSLTAYSEEELIARDYLRSDNPDLVVVVVDASNLERNLYLVTQILELGLPMVLVLNMSDVARAMGLRIDKQAVSQQLGGVAVVEMTATRREGLDELRQALMNLAEELPGKKGSRRPFRIDYGPEIEAEIDALVERVANRPVISQGLEPRWLAVKLLEGEPDLLRSLKQDPGAKDILEVLRSAQQRLEARYPEGAAIAVADKRYAFVSQVVAESLSRPRQAPTTLSERLDRVLTHPLLGVPIFLGVMYFVFRLIVDVSAPYLEWVDYIFGEVLARWALAGIGALGAPEWLRSLLVEGVIAGVGGVLVFVPGLIVLFTFIGILEDSGYLARAAFVMNRFMSFLGLSGKSFVPLVLGFGCAVPAIYATRTLDRRRDRILTALLVPLMSCSARLPVYVVFSLALFGPKANLVIWSLYALGVFMAALVGLLFGRLLFRSEVAPHFVLELPLYRLPMLRGLWFHVSGRVGRFLRHAGTVILAASVAIWFLLNMPWGTASLERSWFGSVSKAIAPLYRPAGFGKWEAAGSLLAGLVAKEVVVSTMSQVYLGGEAQASGSGEVDVLADLKEVGAGFLSASVEAGKRLLDVVAPGWRPLSGTGVESPALGKVLAVQFTPLSAVAFLVYVLLYVPCVATLGAIRGEFGHRWASFSAAYQLVLAWIMAVGVYQIGCLLGLG